MSGDERFAPLRWLNPGVGAVLGLSLLGPACVYDVPELESRTQLARSPSSAPGEPTQIPPLPSSDPGQSAATDGGQDAAIPLALSIDASIITDAGPLDPLPPRCLDPDLVPRVFVSGQTGPQDIEVNGGEVFWLDRNLFNAKAGQLKVREESGGPVTTLNTGMFEPFAIAVDSTHVYFTAPPAGNVNRVKRDVVDSFQNIANNQQGPHGLAIDDTHVYWASFGAGSIRKFAKSQVGKMNATHTVLADQPKARMLTIDETHVYFGTDQGVVGKVAKSGGSVEQLLTPNELGPLLGTADLTRFAIYDLKVVEDWVYLRARALREDPVRDDPGVMMRVGTDGSDPFVLFEDKRAGLSFLEFADGRFYLPLARESGEVWRFTPDGNNITVLSCQQEPNPTSVAVSSNWVYWTNNRGASIMRTRNR